MRDAFVRALMREAAADPRLTLITGDLGFGVLKPFWETYPDQFVNAGIAEQGMTGLAAGLARTGRTVLTYSIGNFPTLRCIEQIRNDCAYHDANVKIVCVGGGFVYGSLGMSHHATEDMAVLRALPGVTVFTPGDPAEVEAVVPVMLRTSGTCYLRLGRGGEPMLHDGEVADWTLPRALTLRQGTDVALLSAGGILTQTVSAARLLQEQGVSAEVVSFPCLKPIDREKLMELAGRFRHLVTVEEHSIVGGFGSAVCEVIAETGMPCRVHRIGMEDVYSCIVGTQQYLRGQYRMDDRAICERTLAWLAEHQ
ncbi:MAG: transketolase C-terminal domain-containing protein [Eubacteriales bacterium]|nr:transketolase C-terminal domain-containing protein [Eubacteriales bacterium]